MHFIHHFGRLLWLVREMLLALLTLMVIGAAIVSLAEGMGYWKALYLTFVTAITIGYGDIAPVTVVGRITCILLGLLGLMFFGIIVAVTNRALTHTIEEKYGLKAKDGH
jgi:voltage-gated potassium channel